MPFVNVHRYPNAGIVGIELLSAKYLERASCTSMFGVHVFQILRIGPVCADAYTDSPLQPKPGVGGAPPPCLPRVNGAIAAIQR